MNNSKVIHNNHLLKSFHEFEIEKTSLIKRDSNYSFRYPSRTTKLNILSGYDPEIELVAIYPKELKTRHRYVFCFIFLC